MTECEMCSDQLTNEEIHLHARCHLTAPLAVSKIDGFVIIRCYLPECGREVARFKLAPEGDAQ